MDEQTLNLEEDIIKGEDKLYRIVEDSKRAKDNGFAPSTSCFSLNEADKKEGYGLSTDWEKKTTPEESIARVGCTYKVTKSGENAFKDYSNRVIYALTVSFLQELSEIQSILYNPLNKFPPVKGRPDNPAHSLIVFNKENFAIYEPMILLKLRDHAKEQKIPVDMNKVDFLVNEYRNGGD